MGRMKHRKNEKRDVESSTAQPSSPPVFQSSGFTMIELLVVLGIILVMAAVAVASFSGAGTPKQQLRREARDLNRLFKEARHTAMARKLKVDVYVDPAARSVCTVESGYARKLLAENGRFFSDGDGLTDFEPKTNRFFRTVVFPEEIELEAFALEDIEPETSGDEPLFETVPEKAGTTGADEPSEISRPVFSFTHLGGASGGGISVARDDLRIGIACDVLTGQPQIVRRRAAQ